MHNFFQSAHNRNSRNSGRDLSAHGKRQNMIVGRKADYHEKMESSIDYGIGVRLADRLWRKKQE